MADDAWAAEADDEESRVLKKLNEVRVKSGNIGNAGRETASHSDISSGTNAVTQPGQKSEFSFRQPSTNKQGESKVALGSFPLGASTQKQGFRLDSSQTENKIGYNKGFGSFTSHEGQNKPDDTGFYGNWGTFGDNGTSARPVQNPHTNRMPSQEWDDPVEAGANLRSASGELPPANGIVSANPSAPANANFVDGSRDDQEGEQVNAADVSYLNKILHTKLVQINNDVKIHRKNPNSPLFSVKSFQELNLRPELLKGVFNMGFTYPSKIQESALPTLLADPPQNMIAQSQSGTGKTAAFVLAALSRVKPENKYPQVLCLSPTYELTLQTGKVFSQMAKYCPDIKVTYAVRGERVARGMQVTEQIIIGTPGTLLDWAIRYRCFDPQLVVVYILDEADVMIAQQGHQDQSIRIHRLLSPTCQLLLFSATYDEQVMDFAESLIVDPIMITLRRDEETLDTIRQYYVDCRSKEQKYQALSNIYGALTIGQCMVFCHTKRTAGWLAEQMCKDGHAVALLSGELTIEQRAAVIQRFRDGKEKVLISTNVCARGIDVEQVTIVINFDLPITQSFQADYETYLHRIGRTGRFGKAGIAINFVDGPRSRAVLEDIERHFGKKIQRLDADDVEEIEKIQ